MCGYLGSYINQRHYNTVTHCLPAAMELTTFYLTNKTRNGYYQSRKFVTINKDSQTLTFGNIDQSSGVELKTCIVRIKKAGGPLKKIVKMWIQSQVENGLTLPRATHQSV